MNWIRRVIAKLKDSPWFTDDPQKIFDSFKTQKYRDKAIELYEKLVEEERKERERKP